MPQRVLHIRGEAFRIADPCLPPSNCRQQLGEVEALPRHTAASGLFPRFIAKRAPPGMFVKSATLPQSWDNFVLVPPPPKAAHPPSWLDSPAVPSVITPSMHIRPGRTWTTLTNGAITSTKDAFTDVFILNIDYRARITLSEYHGRR